MKAILKELFEHRKLSQEQARQVLIKISNAEYNDAQIAAFISVYLMRAITVEELTGFRDALMELCISVELGGVKTIDMCGTGGDGKNTFNISTLAAFVVAGAGYKVAKHGNSSVSSACGSSDVLECMGYKFSSDSSTLKRQLESANICFMHAPLFHPAMKTVGPIRKQLAMKTFFNMLGPIVNPSNPSHQLVGVFNKELGRLYQYIFQRDNEKKYAIIHSLDGYDEVSLTSAFVLRATDRERLLQPYDLGLDQLDPSALHGGNTIADAKNIFSKVLQAEGSKAQHAVVIANAAIAIQTLSQDEDHTKTLTTCVAEATESLMSKSAWNTFKKLIAIN